MPLLGRLKILPLLVFVAFLAFSVRAVDLVSGFYTMSGVAYAVEKPDENMPLQGAPAGETIGKDEGGFIVDDAELDEEDGNEPTLEELQKEAFGEEEPVDWLDASDSDLEYSAVRMEIFKDLSKRREELQKREQSIATREALLNAAEKEMDQKYQELIQLRSEIEGLLEQQSEEEKARLDSLVRIYEGMKAKEAARIFDTLDLSVLVAVMGKMSERKLSPILANMNPERARTVTILLAEQKRLPELPQSN